ncbi:hypothetical protein PDK43_27280 [Bacillus cereus group sp. BcHK10]|nr:hypothetical protein [Bacillus cereus group sp. BcHK10]MDA1963683.1 hypothetical protein [Bacillus cereus group sp. BcHK10]
MRKLMEKLKKYRSTFTIIAEFCSVAGFVLSVIALILTVSTMA